MFSISEDYWEVRDTKLKGKGVYAKKQITKGTIIGDYVGKLMPMNEIDFEEEKRNMYLMYYKGEYGIYPDLSKPGVHLINHSCEPNSWIYKYLDHTLVFALKDIPPEEELTISYLLPPKLNCNLCTHTCYCGSLQCKGTMHLSEKAFIKWQNFQKINYQSSDNNKRGAYRKLKLLRSYPEVVSNKYIENIINLSI